MQNESVISKPLIDWGVASRPLPGEAVCGDLHLIKQIPDGVLLAVADGLGHGDEATLAARTALDLLEAHSEEPLEALVKRCHDALTKTRGAVMTVATLNSFEEKLTWLGVGNVEAVLFRAGDQAKAAAECVPAGKEEGNSPLARSPEALSERVLLRGGIVGYRIPELHTSTQSIQPGDLLVFVTDGIKDRFTSDLPPGEPQQLADLILERNFKGTDDALVLVVRYVGTNHE